MTKIQKLELKIEELKENIFQVEMIDRWTQHNEEMWENYHQELRQVEQQLEKELNKGVK
jgi:hypothetical protein